MKNKLLIYFILIFNLSCSQRTTIFLSKESHEYKIENVTEEGKEIVIEINLKNLRNKPVAFVLDTTTLGKYYSIDEYVFESSSKYSSINENIFAPRIMLLENNKPLLFNRMISSTQYTEVAFEDLIRKREDNLQKKNQLLKDYQKKFFPSKKLDFVERAKYINDNLIILEPKGSLNFKILFNPYFYKYPNSNHGWNLELSKNYLFTIKIHNDKKLVMKYLNKSNLEKIKKEKIYIEEKDLETERILLKTK